MFDFIRAAPGISPTSPGSVSTNSISAFGSGTNENAFLIDGTNFTCPCSGEARSEPGVDFIQEMQVQSVGASAEFGNAQGAVINVITRQGGDRFLFDASYYGRRGVHEPTCAAAQSGPGAAQSGYERVEIPRLHDEYRRARAFAIGCGSLPDTSTSATTTASPAPNPAFPRTYEQDKVFAKLTWRLAPGLQLMQSLHGEFWVNPELPTVREAVRGHAAPARVRARHDLRPPDTHAVVQYGLGRARRPVRVQSRMTIRARANVTISAGSTV